MKAIIMAGGKAERLDMDIEKPLLEIGGKTILERISEVLRSVIKDEIIVAVTENTPNTEKKAKALNLKVMKTPAQGYVEDIQYLMERFGVFLVVSSDLPYLSLNLIRNVLAKYEKEKRPICVVVSREDYEGMGFVPSVILGDLVPIGVNVVAKGEDSYYIAEGEETMNINTKQELEMTRNHEKCKMRK